MTAGAPGPGAELSGAPPDPLGRVEVHPGPGLVLRRHDVVLVVPAVEAPRRDLAAEVALACTGEGGEGGRDRLRRLTGLLARDTAHRLPAFACVTGDGDEVLLLVHGAVPVRVDGREQVFTMGADSTGWVERSLPATFTHLRVGAADTGPDDDADRFPFELLDGSVPGSAATLHRIGPPARVGGVAPAAEEVYAGGDPAARETAMTVLRQAPHLRVVDLAPRPRDPSRTPSPLPIGSPAPTGSRTLTPPGGVAAPGVTAPVLVHGIVCGCGELNNPVADECRVCGADLDPAQPQVTGVRPPLGILITDDGRVFTLTDDVVVGREPGQAPEVRDGRARPLVLRDGEQSTSRVHALIRLSGWEVEVVDRGSANGTFISRSGSAGPWAQVPPGPGTALAPGDRLRVGKRQLLFDRYRTA